MLLLTLPYLLQQAIIPTAQDQAPVAETDPVAVIAEDVKRHELATIHGAIAAGRLDEAVALLQRFDTQDPAGSAQLAVLRGEIAVEKELLFDAEKLVAPVAAAGNLRCPVERIRGLALAQRETSDAAIDRLAAVAESCDPDWRVWAALGRQLAERGEGEAARFAFANAIDAAGSRSRVHTDFARALIKLGDLDGATEQLRAAIGRDAADGDAKRLLDYVAGMRGVEPERAAADTDELWAQRLADSAEGARQAARPELARALFSEALLASPRYDRRLLVEAGQQR